MNGSDRRFNRECQRALVRDGAGPDLRRPCLDFVRPVRLGRSLSELLATVDTLDTWGIGLVSLEEKLDTTTATGELVFHVFGAISHFERRHG